MLEMENTNCIDLSFFNLGKIPIRRFYLPGTNKIPKFVAS